MGARWFNPAAKVVLLEPLQAILFLSYFMEHTSLLIKTAQTHVFMGCKHFEMYKTSHWLTVGNVIPRVKNTGFRHIMIWSLHFRLILCISEAAIFLEKFCLLTDDSYVCIFHCWLWLGIIGHNLWHWLPIHSTIQNRPKHYNYVIMSAMTSQITNVSLVYSTDWWGADQRKAPRYRPLWREFTGNGWASNAENISICWRHHDQMNGRIMYIPLTHWGRLTHVYISITYQHWFRYWFVACTAPSHYLIQWW